jgi:predicted nucleic acid-binding protein
LIKILSSGVLLLTMVKREDRINYEHKFRKLKDKSDIPHAILAFINNCKIVTYDKHFNAIKDVIQIITPEEILKEIRK